MRTNLEDSNLNTHNSADRYIRLKIKMISIFHRQFTCQYACIRRSEHLENRLYFQENLIITLQFLQFLSCNLVYNNEKVEKSVQNWISIF